VLEVTLKDRRGHYPIRRRERQPPVAPVLVQREMESWRTPLASIAPIPPGQFAPPKAVAAGRKGQRLATGFKRRSGWLVVPFTTGRVGHRSLTVSRATRRLGLKQRLILDTGKRELFGRDA